MLTLLALAAILFFAKIGGHLAVRFKQPEVLGELVTGIFLGNLALFGVNAFEFLRHDEALEILSELGIIILLFEVGLETKLTEMRRVGASSLLVALLGVVAPFLLGWRVAAYFLPERDTIEHIFVGAVLVATSVGITARVLKDLGKLQAPEAKIILGAAVIDDVLGLVVLAVVSGLAVASETGAAFGFWDIGEKIGIAFGFLAAAVVLGRPFSRLYFSAALALRSGSALLAAALTFCFILAFLAGKAGLAPIVGAFAAGLVIEPEHYRDKTRRGGGEPIESLLAPIAAFLVPVFFVSMGIKVNLAELIQPSILLFSVILTAAAVLGKQLCSFGVLERGRDRLAVGFGMIPRGEVGLIFAGIGTTLMYHGHPVVGPATYGAVVLMVIVTTLITPPLLKTRFEKRK